MKKKKKNVYREYINNMKNYVEDVRLTEWVKKSIGLTLPRKTWERDRIRAVNEHFAQYELPEDDAVSSPSSE